MSWDEKHGCEGPGWNGSAEHLGDPLTVEQIKALKPGTRIVVTWSGGNGPWEGTVALDPHEGVCHETEGGVLNALLNWPETQTSPLNRVTLAVPRDAIEQMAAEQGPRWRSRKEAWLDGWRQGQQQARMTGADKSTKEEE